MTNDDLQVVVGARPVRVSTGESETTELEVVPAPMAEAKSGEPVDAHGPTMLGLPPPLPMKPAPSKRPDERRIATRVALDADVSLFSPTTFWAGLAEDISEGGLFVATYQVQPMGTRIDLRFELPTGHAVSVGGVVRWHRGMSDDSMPGMGIAFEGLSPSDAKVIQSFIKHRPPLLWDMD